MAGRLLMRGMSIERVWVTVTERVCLVEQGPAGPCAKWPCDLPQRVVTEGITPWRLRPSGRILCSERRAATYRRAVTDEERLVTGWSDPVDAPDWLDLAKAKQEAARDKAERDEAAKRKPWPKPPLRARPAKPHEIPSPAEKRAASGRAAGWEVSIGYSVLYVAGARRVPDAGTADADIGGLADGARKKRSRGKDAPPAEVTPVRAEHIIVVGRRGDQAWQAVWERRAQDWTFHGATSGRKGDRWTRRLKATELTAVIKGA